MFVSFLRVNALTFCGQYFSSNDVCKSAGIFVNASKIPVFFLAEFSDGGTLEMISRLADKKTLYSSMYAKLNVYIVNLRALHSAKVFAGHNKNSMCITVCKNTVIMPFIWKVYCFAELFYFHNKRVYVNLKKFLA